MKERMKKLLDQVYEHLHEGKTLDWSLNDVLELIEWFDKNHITLESTLAYEMYKTIGEMETVLKSKKRRFERFFDFETMKRKEGITSWTIEKEWTEPVKFKQIHDTHNPRHKQLSIEKYRGIWTVIAEWIEDD